MSPKIPKAGLIKPTIFWMLPKKSIRRLQPLAKYRTVQRFKKSGYKQCNETEFKEEFEMKIFHKGKDISTLVKKITWSGSRMQVARKLVFDYVQDDRDTLIPVLEINNGETIFGYDEENNIVFRGNVFDVEKKQTEFQCTNHCF
mgnify:CR=1 FL=1